MTTGELLPTRRFGRGQDPVARTSQQFIVPARTPWEWERVAKRTLDVVGSVLGLVILLPLLFTTALLVRITSPGPALYRQERVGLHGRQFRLWKFRSMTCNADERVAELMAAHGGYIPFYKMREDPRVTPFGRFLRRSSLDELPQLINVLKGEMSLVGPRPQVWDEVEQYEPEQHRRHLVKPGITGLWQVSGRSDIPPCEAVQLDLEYVDTWSLRGDLHILLKTARAVATTRGAY
jgi:exopolysaccharide biosynthesis polyprenyl glycosylphosphotransferase